MNPFNNSIWCKKIDRKKKIFRFSSSTRYEALEEEISSMVLQKMKSILNRFFPGTTSAVPWCIVYVNYCVILLCLIIGGKLFPTFTVVSPNWADNAQFLLYVLECTVDVILRKNILLKNKWIRKKTDKKNEEDFYNYHNSNKLLFKKANKIEKKEDFVLKEISNKINSQQNCVIIDENGGRSGSSNKIIKKNLKNLIHTENFMSQSFNTNFDGMIEKVDSFFADDIDPKNINSNRSESISIFSVPTNIYATKNKEEGSSLIQPYSDMADFENKFNEIDL